MAEPESLPPSPPILDRHRFTGSHCPPGKRQAIVNGIKAGTAILPLARQVGASPHTVMVIRDQEVPDWRKVQSSNLERVGTNIVQSLLAMTPEQLAETGLSERCIALGIVMDKKAMLDGEPSQIIEHRHSADVSSLTSVLTQHVEIDVTESAQLPADYQQTPETKGNTPDSQG